MLMVLCINLSGVIGLLVASVLWVLMATCVLSSVLCILGFLVSNHCGCIDISLKYSHKIHGSCKGMPNKVPFYLFSASVTGYFEVSHQVGQYTASIDWDWSALWEIVSHQITSHCHV